MKPVRLLSFVLIVLAASRAAADIKLPAIFGDHMVLQRDGLAPLWGWASPNESVTVMIGLTGGTTTADEHGKWTIHFKNLAVSDKPVDINVIGQSGRVTIHDVLIGDVWVCAGESHMAVPLGQMNPAPDKSPTASQPEIRFFVPKYQRALTPQSDLDGTWQVGTPDTAKSFSKLAYCFAQEIAEKEQAPVGIIGLYGQDTSAQSWVSQGALEADPDLKQGYITPFTRNSAGLDLVQLARAHDQWLASAGKVSDHPPGSPQTQVPVVAEPPQPDNPGLPSVLNNALIAPVAPYAVKGIVWYQGESNLGQGGYGKLLSALIGDWRKQWQRDDLPFLFVQTPPPYPASQPQPDDSPALAFLREAQSQTLKAMSNTGMASTIDLSADVNTRSVDNAEVAHRLATLAFNRAYGEDIVSSGPIFDSYRFDGNEIHVTFSNVGHGLKIAAPAAQQNNPNATDEIKGFAIAGPDHKFVWAKATIEGPDTVCVSGNGVADPAFVHYGWNDRPDGNLCNDADFPAAPFRSEAPELPPSDASLVAQTDDFFSIDRIHYYDSSPTEQLAFFKEVPSTNDDGTPGTTKVFTPYLETDVRVREATKPDALIARAYFYDQDKKLIASVQAPNTQSASPIWPAILPKDTVQPVFFVVPDAVVQAGSWSAVIVFGDSKGVTAQLYSESNDFDSLSDFDYPGKEPPKQQADNAVHAVVDRQAVVDPIVTHVEQTENPEQPQITLIMRPPLGVTSLADAKGVLCLCLLANSVESVKRQLQGFEPNQDLSGTLKFAEDHHLIIICWGSHGLWNAQKNWDDLSPDSAWYTDKAFDQVADAWEHGVQYFVKEYKIPPNGYLLWGMSGSAQFACRLALRKPDYFLAIHAHIPSSFDKPTPEARKILWCLTTGELEAGHANSLRFYEQCKALGYPIIYKAVVGLGHADSPIAEDLGAKFFEYALSVRDQRLKYDASANDPFAQFQMAQASPAGPAPWIESFCKPVYVGDIVNQELFPGDETDMVPASLRTPLPTKDIADAWNK